MTTIAELRRLKATRDALLKEGPDINPHLAQRFAVTCLLLSEAFDNLHSLAQVTKELLERVDALEAQLAERNLVG